LPKGKKLISRKWVFKTNRDTKGNVERYKVCLIADGFTQTEVIDYKETFSLFFMKNLLELSWY